MACWKIASKTRFCWSLTMDLWGENGLCVSLTKHLKIRGDHWSSGNQPHGTGESAVFLEDVPIESSISFGDFPPSARGPHTAAEWSPVPAELRCGTKKGWRWNGTRLVQTLRPGNFLGLAMKNHETPWKTITHLTVIPVLAEASDLMSILDFPNLCFADFPAKLYHRRGTTASPRRPVTPLHFQVAPAMARSRLCWSVMPLGRPSGPIGWADPRGSAEEGEFHRLTPELDRNIDGNGWLLHFESLSFFHF